MGRARLISRLVHCKQLFTMADQPKFLPPPENAASLAPSEARQLFRLNRYYGPTSGFCLGHLQANMAVLPEEFADDFEEFCRKNYGPFPLIYRSAAGEIGAPPLAKDSDIRTDLPRYFVYSNGQLVEDTLDLSGFSWENRVTFYLGCSFTFEDALIKAGVGIRNIEENKNVGMFLSTIKLYQVGSFDCEMFVTMRPIQQDLLATAFSVSAQFPNAHGAPIHIGDPGRIGITDLSKPTRGDVVQMKEDDIPVFWACGFTVREAVKSARPSLAFTHYAGSMFISDIKCEPKDLEDYPEIVPLSRESTPQCSDPFFASVIGQKSAKLFSKLEQIILDDPGNRGVAHLFQKSDLLKAVLALSHSERVAVTTGFPCHTDHEVKDETDGLPGALAICQALLALGKKVTLVSDGSNQALFESCVNHMVSVGALKSQVPVLPFSQAKELYDTSDSSSKPPFDCLLAIERTGRAADGTYRTMKGRDVSQYVDPVDSLFTNALTTPRVFTICIGDGGNELGMGKVYEQVKKYVPLGDKIACVVAANFVIAAGVSNWAGYAVALGLYLASTSQLHWRYRNHAINAETPPSFSPTQFLPTADQTTSLLKYMNSLGVRDGCTGTLDQSVDGLPLEVQLRKLEEIMALVA